MNRKARRYLLAEFKKEKEIFKQTFFSSIFAIASIADVFKVFKDIASDKLLLKKLEAIFSRNL